MSSVAQGVSITAAVDTGGTFTDCVIAIGGALHIAKVPSTPHDPAAAVRQALAAALPPGVLADLLVHGSTVATNTLLERTGARVILITNRGFEDVIALGRQDRPHLYALHGERPTPLVAEGDCIGVSGRLDETGTPLEALDEGELAGLGVRVGHAEAIAICLLHSYANGAHEDAIHDALASVNVPVSRSGKLLREYREYERFSTAVVNAYVAPRMEGYLGRVETESAATRIRIMGSGGGALRVERARREPVHTIRSGPAGGVAGARAAAQRAGFEDILTFDMGGTSTDVALCPGRLLHTRELQIAGVPVAIPMLDIHTVGAGGGSIAHVDHGGALRVGPRSAGAVPGPVCYGLGGTDVTVTDASVWLGRLPATAWSHGTPLDRDAVRAPLGRLAAELGISPDATAEGIIDIVNTSMEGALRVISVERGYDPADFTLVAFGGAAGLHACELARRLGVARVLIPSAPGVLSAFGMLVAPVLKQTARTILVRGAALRDFELDDAFRALEAEALDEMAQEGVTADAVTLTRTIDTRYRGQSYELAVREDGDWVAAFHAAHEQRFGHAQPGAEIEAVTLRVAASSAPALGDDFAFQPDRAVVSSASTPLIWQGSETEARFVGRSDATPGMSGPAVIVEYSATTFLPPDWRVARANPDDGALLLERAPRAAS